MSEKAIEISILSDILAEHVDSDQKEHILREVQKALKEEEQAKADTAAAEKPPKIEKKTVVIITALPPGVEACDIRELAGFITEIPEENPTRELIDGLRRCKEDYAGTKKSRKNPADSLGELFELAPVKIFKENGICKKPKGPVEFIYIPNRPNGEPAED